MIMISSSPIAVQATSPFVAPRGLGHPHLQALLATKRPARWLWRRHGIDLDSHSQWHVLDAGNGIRLSGMHTPAIDPARSRGLVVLIHGWEGSHDSSYLYSMASRLHREGYALFRLNLRDHGGTHQLNQGMFNSARTDEVLAAIQAAQRIEPALPLVVIGYSLGGNFALRVGLHGPAHGLHPALCIAVSPMMNPLNTLQAIDLGPWIFKRHFLSKWRDTMTAKEKAWPGVYDFNPQRRIENFVALTDRFVRDCTEFSSLDEYLQAYTLSTAQLCQSPTPLALMTALDDSVIPYRDFEGLTARGSAGSVVSFDASARGGHCGFIHDWKLECWAELRIMQLLAELKP